MHYIYKITDIQTGEYYIGKRCNTNPDKDDYYGSGSNRLCNSAKKHKGAGYIKEVLIFVADKALLSELERDFIGENYKGGSDHDPLCLNLKAGGIGGGTKGRPKSEEHKRKIAESNRGQLRTDSTKKRLSESHKGLIRSEEQSANQSEAQRGRVFSAETRAKLSQSLKGKSKSEEHKKNMSESLKLRVYKPFSEEHKKNMSESAKKRLSKKKEETK